MAKRGNLKPSTPFLLIILKERGWTASDNSLFHDWKEEVRKHTPATKHNIEQLMNDAWAKMDPKQHYQHCGLTRSKDPYFDCPAPAAHRHGSR